MSGRVDTRLTDRMVDAYVDWREECLGVWEAYERWASSAVRDRPVAFSAYRAALEREEHAARVYADLITRVTASARRPAGIAGPVVGALRIAGELSTAFTRVVGSAD
jgi:hypothetical protein